jgi:hypothetical protein
MAPGGSLVGGLAKALPSKPPFVPLSATTQPHCLALPVSGQPSVCTWLARLPCPLSKIYIPLVG